MKYFYHSQIRRYLVQVIRIFSDIKYERKDGDTKIQTTIPVIYGDSSRQVSQILAGFTQNVTLPVPMMSVRITDIALAPERRNNPMHESSIHLVEREFKDGAYTDKPGKRVTIDRYMPVPYDITFDLDIWTSNTETKMQILEQILTIFNPSIQLQQTDNVADWTSIFEVELIDVNWSSRTIPEGADSQRDIATLRFKSGIWISPPAKIRRQELIEQIVTNIRSSDGMTDAEITDVLENKSGIINRVITTPGNFEVSLGEPGKLKNELILLPSTKSSIVSWEELINLYGHLDPSTTKIRLKLDPDIEDDTNDIIAYASYGPTPDSLLLDYDETTLPQETIRPIDRIIDPVKQWPGKNLDIPVEGTRYLILSKNIDEKAIPDDHSYWGNLEAYGNDIIEFDGTNWFVSESLIEREYEVVYNLSNQDLYTYRNGEWSYSYLGIYKPGYWRIEGILSNESLEDILDDKC